MVSLSNLCHHPWPYAPLSATKALAANGPCPTISGAQPRLIDSSTVKVSAGTMVLYQTSTEAPASKDYGVDVKNPTFSPTHPLTVHVSCSVIARDTQDPDGEPLPTFTSAFFTGPQPQVVKDVNNDKVFNLEDVKEVLRIVGGLKPASTQAVSRGDGAVPNGSLTFEDAVALRKRLPSTDHRGACWDGAPRLPAV